jgi:hypothetical protein
LNQIIHEISTTLLKISAIWYTFAYEFDLRPTESSLMLSFQSLNIAINEIKGKTIQKIKVTMDATLDTSC